MVEHTQERGAAGMDAVDDAPQANEGARRAIREFLESAHNDDRNSKARTLLVSGAPRSGKTQLAVETTLAGLRADLAAGSDGSTVMLVPNRRVADLYSDRIIRELGSSERVRPATTLNALAFQLLEIARSRSGDSAPRLINGAEQDALLRHVIAVHVEQHRRGEDGSCETCRLLSAYFENAGVQADPARKGMGAAANSSSAGTLDWATIVMDAADANDADEETIADIAANVNAGFIAQLRDVFAHFDEVGALLRLGAMQPTAAARNVEEWTMQVACQAVESEGPAGVRLSLQWRLALALRREYFDLVARRYPGEYRLDPSYLPLAAMRSLTVAGAWMPTLLVVDDVQDLTLGGLALLAVLQGLGVHLVLFGDPDEAVQAFRGSYPEYLYACFLDPNGPFAADHVSLQAFQHEPATYRDIVASRVSLSIASAEESALPLAQRPGKLPAVEGSDRLRPLDADDPHTKEVLEDGSLNGRLYRSSNDELDNIVWQISALHLNDRSVTWNDMAVICHDNADVLRFGERLRGADVPVRYSSVTRPLADEPFVQGLFALIELAQLRAHGLETRSMTLAAAAQYVRARVGRIAESLLIDTANMGTNTINAHVRSHRKPTRPMRLNTVNAALSSLEALARISQTDILDDASATADPDRSALAESVKASALSDLRSQWDALASTVRAAHAAQEQASGIVVDDSRLSDTDKVGDGLEFGIDALYLLLAQGDDETLLDVLEALCGDHNEDVRNFNLLWRIVGQIADDLGSLPSKAPQYALEAAWKACHVADAWKVQAIFDSPDGRAANDRLDTAMRLFNYVQSEGVAPDINAFIDQVRQLQIEADSLASLAPVDEAVTLTTPAGTAGLSWEHVWIPAVQQGTWPNLAARNTMFGGEDLVDIALHGSQTRHRNEVGGQLDEVLASEQKGWLVALTRANGTLNVSASQNDDAVPSDFLYAYLPECFTRDDTERPLAERLAEAPDAANAASGKVQTEASVDTADHGYSLKESERHAGDETLNASMRGVIALARIALAHGEESSAEFQDAAAALAALASAGVDEADPRRWPFLRDAPTGSRSPGRYERTQSGNAVQSAGTALSLNAGSAQSGVSPQVMSVPTDPFAPIVLSPSQVDRLWGCAVCARLERDFSGPTPSAVVADFGTLVHDAAQYATEHHWDLAQVYEQFVPIRGPHTDTWREQTAQAIADRMFDEYYAPRRIDPLGIEDASQRFVALQRDAEAKAMLFNIARYFVDSNEADYIHKTTGAIGTLVESFAECSFEGAFTLRSITDAYNHAGDRPELTVQQMRAILGVLMDGWPVQLDDGQEVRINGRIDRLEHRRFDNGDEHWRVVDYKTGNSFSPAEQFSDLQLVCYQLGLAFNTDGSTTALTGPRPKVSRAELFFVKDQPAPAGTATRVESYYQPALMEGGAVTSTGFAARYYIPHMSSLFKMQLPSEAPDGIPEEVWHDLLAGAQEGTLWALTMLARVFYAAAAKQADHIVAHPTDAHRGVCRHKQVCAACNEAMATVFETEWE